tara:strand:- start:18 stop:122 length:105 start_codon:yes stop_codon:yes gene_type:complete
MADVEGYVKEDDSGMKINLGVLIPFTLLISFIIF